MSYRHRTACSLLALSLALAAATPALAQQNPPALQAVVGHDSGERITRSADVRRYFEALQAANPDRVVMGDYARSWEGRPLFWAAVGSPRNIARLNAIKAATNALADPRKTSPEQARALINDTPAVVWMAYSVHGNEISPADAALTAARRLTDSLDAEAQGWLENVVVVFVPTQNPDGRERFINSFEAGLGAQPNGDPLSAERAEPWPSGRFNHNLFDLNRDWFIQSQPETQGHAALIREWRPQVVVDSHEMGTDSSFFFPPEAEPLNPWIYPAILEARERFGRNNAARFDQAGLDYFTRETFDAFYPGYGDGWPAYFGAVSMTYEQGSSRGLLARRSSGEMLTYADTVQGHLTATLSTIETAARDREKLLNDFYAFHRDGMAGGRGAYVLSRSAAADPAAADKLAGLLVRSGLEVGRATASFSACGQSYQAGDYVVNLSQPQRRMAETLLARDVPLDPKFLAEQEARRARGLSDEIYDLTGWSLPLLFNVPSQRCANAPSVQTAAVGPELIRPAAVASGDAAYGYAIHPGTAGMRFLTAALTDRLPVRSIEEPFTLDGRAYPGGTFIVPRAGSPADLDERVRRLAAGSGAQVTPLATSWVSRGPSVGSDRAVVITAPRVALAWDDPTDPESAGSIRHVLEREYGWPVTAVRTRRLTHADLSRYQVLILPSGGNYEQVLSESGVANLRAWVQSGGVLIGVGSASRLLTDPDSKLLDSRRETALDPEDGRADDASSATVAGSEIASDIDYLERTAHRGGSPDSVAGVLARALVDNEHWLGAGVATEVSVMVRGSDIYTPLTRDQGSNVVRLAGPDSLRASGQLWNENRRQLAYKPVAMTSGIGRGQVVAFTQDVTMRAFLEGLKPLFLNAVFRGPAHASGDHGED
ncbi:M14 family metallopeptidase [Brevundimonas pondensis]|uniref:Zinc carboxypeptidase n=1 Tax=Brevundimonas pondensis TaxID=2774189 RepID=A0ABX7SHQ0_9CAUL|nr:M14 family metallopeptidase [Brevundimonas pondensis]QTC87187.1 zinc carboxypeptidase [Brevundimonas pondensis]